MKVVTSIGLFNDAVGRRMSVTYSEIDDNTGQVLSDNKRADRVITDKQMKAIVDEIQDYAQNFVEEQE